MYKKQNKKTVTFQRGEYKTSSFNAKGVMFGKLYLEQRVWVKYLIAVAVGVVYGTLGHFLIKIVGATTYGLSALLQGFARFITYEISVNGLLDGATISAANVLTILFWGLMLVVNIPLFIFGGIKVGKRFTLLSFTFMAVSTLVGIGIGFIPGADNIFLFGNTTLTGTDQWQVWIQNMDYLGIRIVPFTPFTTAGYDYSNYAKPFMLILSTIIYAPLAAIAFAILFIVGGSTAGTDFISVYIARVKKKDIAIVFFCVNIVCVILGSVIGTYLPASLYESEFSHYQYFFSSNLVATILSLLVFSFFFRRFYPRSRKYNIKIISDKNKQLITNLKQLGYNNSYSLTKYDKKETSYRTVCTTMELPLLLSTANNIDNRATVIITDIFSYGGTLDIYQIGSDK